MEKEVIGMSFLPAVDGGSWKDVEPITFEEYVKDMYDVIKMCRKLEAKYRKLGEICKSQGSESFRNWRFYSSSLVG